MENQTKIKKEKTNISMIAIPKKMLYHKDLNTKSKYMYIILRKHVMNNKIKINYSTLMESLKWKDKRTFKKYLLELHNQGFIKLKDYRISQYKPIEIKIPFKKPFVQIDREILERCLKLQYYEKGLLFLFTVEDYYNIDWGYSCPSMQQICAVTKTSHNDIKKIGKLYHDNFICEYHTGNKIEGTNKRYRNRYIPNILYYDDWLNKIKRRYKRHKSTDYFYKQKEEE